MRPVSEYVLGTGGHELARLVLQQEVWGGVTRRFLERVGLRCGARVLDLGCGPGLVLADLRQLVGPQGEVVAFDESPAWRHPVEELVARCGWRNVRFVQGRAQEADLGEQPFDLVFARWVLSFVAEPAALLARLAAALAPGGLLAVQDYNHEGISLFPPSEGFRAVVRGTRALVASRGGDSWIAGRLPALMRSAGLELAQLDADVLCGGPGSPAFRWADAFFPYHSASMVRAGVLAAWERERFLEEWRARSADPAAVFFSPIVVSIAGRRPLPA